MPTWAGIVASISGVFLALWWARRRPIRGCVCSRCRRGQVLLPQCVLASAKARAELAFTSGPMAGRSVTLTERSTIIGSAGGQGSVIVLADPAVSEVHARIERKQGAFRLLDSGSTNGTYVNGVQCTELVLRSDDSLRLGNSEATFRLIS